MEAVKEIPRTMRAVRLHEPTGTEGLRVEVIETPKPHADEVLVRVRAAAITRDELDWPTDRLPAIPSYELSGEVVAAGADDREYAPGDAVYALTAFDRDGVAAEYAIVPAALLAPKPTTLDHVEAASVPMPALTAWQALFEHGRLEAGQRVVVHGVAGGVGAYAAQLGRWKGAHVIGTASDVTSDAARRASADELLEREAAFARVTDADLVFDTVGHDTLARSRSLIRTGGRIVSVAEEPPETLAGTDAVYFVVRPDGAQLAQLTPLVEAGKLRAAVDSVFSLTDAKAAFERNQMPGKNGKVVLAPDQM